MNSVWTSIAPSLSVARAWRTAFLFAALLPLGASASAVWQMNLVGDMPKEGRSVTHPTPGKPVYYFPVVVGFAETGAPLAGAVEQPPPTKELVHDLAVALATQGYFVTHEIVVPAKPGAAPDQSAAVKAYAGPPSLVLVFSWGAMRPQKIEGTDVTDASPPPVMNQNQMIGLIAGKNFDSVADFGKMSNDIWEGIQDDRYFVMIAAYDFDAYFQQHKKVQLWATKMSMPSSGVTMTEVMPALIKAGAPLFGRETIGPKVVDVPNVREGKVEIGTPTVVPPDKN